MIPGSGGAFRQETETDGFTSVVEGSYQQLIPDELIAMNWRFFHLESDDIAKFTVSIIIESGTGLDQATCRIESSLAWTEAFRGLKELVEQ